MIYENRGVVFECDVDIDEREALEYIMRGIDRYGAKLAKVKAHVDGDEIELRYTIHQRMPFDRIRRITGYLVGTLDRFNDAKRAEEHDRVKHGTENKDI